MEVLLLPMDAYFKPEGDRPTATGRTGRSYRDDNNPESFDLPRLRRDVSDAAENGSCRVLIVEGLLTLWDCGLYEQLDLRGRADDHDLFAFLYGDVDVLEHMQVAEALVQVNDFDHFSSGSFPSA